MDKKYAEYLLEKTRQDYNLIADAFSRTRFFIWEELKPLGQYTASDDKVLDLGCGNGRLLQIFEGQNIEYFGVDNSEKLIGIAKGKYPNYNFQTADALSLPFPDDFFDKIYSIAVLHHIPSQELRIRFLKEAKRVLKPAGFLILTVWKFHNFKEAYFRTKFTILKLLSLSKLDFGDIFESWANKIDRYYHCFAERELNSLVKKTDFKIKESGILRNKKGNRLNIYLIAEK